MRAVLTLFEGVATGAADGYARMADAPAATLLHLGPGLGYGLANPHHARRAKVPVVNIVGDHATYDARHDPPLQSDIETIARNVSTWVRTSRSVEELARDAVEAIIVVTGPPGQVATLIVGAILPEGAILSDEAITSAAALPTSPAVRADDAAPWVGPPLLFSRTYAGARVRADRRARRWRSRALRARLGSGGRGSAVGDGRRRFADADHRIG